MKNRILMIVLFMFSVNFLFADNTFDFDNGKTNLELSDYLPVKQPSIVEEEPDCQKYPYKIDENGKIVEIKPSKSYLDEKGNRVNEHYFFPQDKVRWAIRCKNTSGQLWTAKETYGHAYGSGGHYHFDPPSPSLLITNPRTDSSIPSDSSFLSKPSPVYFPQMMPNTTYYYWEKMPEFSTLITEYFEWTGGCSGKQTDYLYVVVPNLIQLSTGTNYVLWGETETHPYNHFGTKKLVDTIVEIANEYKSYFPDSQPLYINDMSLPWGGLFDINNDWKSPHKLHRCGNQVDIRKVMIPQENRRKFIEIVCKKTKFLLNENPPHYHISVNQNEPDYCNPPRTEEKDNYVNCCNGENIDENNIEQCIK
ncbi:MAG TPA: hypothetical protein PK103_06165 [Elusimicrobiales bacterium]|nr:hypothetical protein [Elusimicrobiales bacterium]HOL62933.1 hypothetical protein [Elusimicrobiales bacterium]HPO95821.1 hypothetical protein [Elusimicrobiales bacterium]